jgi:DNA-binding transcriptional regulator YhcF (GntR family)
MHNHIYIRFLTLLHTIEGKGELPVLDLDAKKLLETIAVRHAQGKPLTVTEAMAMAHIASPATIHRKLDVLREIGMIETQFEGSNRRTKFLVPTPQAAKYFQTHSQVMDQALSQTS